MIGLEIKSDAKAPSKLPVSSNEILHDSPNSTSSFASLLAGLKDEKDLMPLTKKGSVVLALGSQTQDDKKSDTKDTKSISSLLELLKGDTKSVQDELDVIALNPKLIQEKSVSEIKVLIQEAKQYLKHKISSLEGFKKSEIAALPKTLKGLAVVAKKFGIDISNITLEQVKQGVNGKLNIASKTQHPVEIKSQESVEKVEKNFSTKSSESAEQSEIEIIEKKSPLKTTKSTTGKAVLADQKAQEQVSNEPSQIKEQKQQVVNEQKSVTETPLFKAQMKPQEITTQQLVHAKVSQENSKVQKQKTQNTLELLLRGEKSFPTETNMTADLSVATAKVIAPNTRTEVQKNLESLLRGDVDEQSSAAVKNEAVQVHKADSFEVKLNEAKQMVKYLSNDVKQAIDDYKAPFTRIKVQLNPQKLGEIDLTVVQRGKNLHINLSSNNAAINTLAMNANDLRVQLSNNGIQNASLNFSNMSQGEQNSAGSHAHQQHHNRQNSEKEYGYFQDEDTHEEIKTSLEIVVPHYA